MVITERKDEEEEEEKEGLMIDRYVFYPTSESHQISGLSNFICLYFFLFACNFLNRCYRLQIVLTGRAHGWPLIRVSPEQEILSIGRGQRAILAFDSFERFLIEIHSKGVNVELVEKLLLHQERRFTVICYVRSKLKQTEMECEYLKRWFGSLMGQNRRLQREVDKLRAVNNHGLCTQAEQLWCFCILFFWNFLIAAKLGISIASWFQLCQVNINPFSSPSGANASCSYDLASKFQGVYFVVSKSSRAAASANTMAQTMVSKSTTLLLLEKKQQWILPQQHQWQL